MNSFGFFIRENNVSVSNKLWYEKPKFLYWYPVLMVMSLFKKYNKSPAKVWSSIISLSSIPEDPPSPKLTKNLLFAIM